VTDVLAAASIGPPGPSDPGWVAIDDGLVVDRGTGRAGRGARDLGDARLAPGFIDLQINGLGGVDLATADAAAWARADASLLRRGVTAYCPTFVTAPLESYDAALRRAAAAREAAAQDPARPEILGVHLEGPFLGDAPGAHDPRLLRPVDTAWLEAQLRRHPGLVRMVTLAPEADPTLAATRTLSAAGVVVALGHSRASYEDAISATDAGARVVTHLFNGMDPLHHRAPGLVGAALADDRLTATLIADGVHVHAALVRIIVRAKKKVALVSDVVALNDDVTEVDGAARRVDGTLVGATALLDVALRRVVGGGVPLTRALELVTAVPAQALGLQDRGRVEPGARADLVALDPSTAAVRTVWRAGVELEADGHP
jgi:N-acetylglucosamine-6-phosphate deacetylase